jgi:hypothetical protein
MIARYLVFALLVGAQFLTFSAVSAKTTVSRKDIRATPILERPSRPGHFYGNTVRRTAGRGNTVLTGSP